jgi:hypothetical protein
MGVLVGEGYRVGVRLGIGVSVTTGGWKGVFEAVGVWVIVAVTVTCKVPVMVGEGDGLPVGGNVG